MTPSISNAAHLLMYGIQNSCTANSWCTHTAHFASSKIPSLGLEFMAKKSAVRFSKVSARPANPQYKFSHGDSDLKTKILYQVMVREEQAFGAQNLQTSFIEIWDMIELSLFPWQMADQIQMDRNFLLQPFPHLGLTTNTQFLEG